MQKLFEHLTDVVSTGYPSAHAADDLRSAELRGRGKELMHILEAIIPLQYDRVTLHTTEIQEILGCRPLLAADMSVFVSDCPFLM